MRPSLSFRQARTTHFNITRKATFNTCIACNGQSKIEKHKTLEIEILADIDDG